MKEFNVLELQIDDYRKQVKCLKELYELENREIDILNTMIEISIPEDEYEKIRNQAILLIKEREEIDE